MNEPTLNGHSDLQFIASPETYEWLEKWLKADASPDDILARAWLYGRPGKDPNWTREKELSEWITESQVDWGAWRGVQRLLEVLRVNQQPIPFVLLCDVTHCLSH